MYCLTMRFLTGVLVGIALAATLLAPAASAAEPRIGAILDQLDSPRGICTIVDDQDAKLAMELAQKTELTIYVQLDDPQQVATARRTADAAGLLNRRVYVGEGTTDHLHLANNMADLVVVPETDAEGAALKEVLRVLRPGGKALLGSTVIVKPVSADTDDWSHPYHGPDNNPQSTDQLARAPYLTQFLVEPWYGPMPEITVASGGRVFKAFGNRAFRQPQWPMLRKLIAINGYNGTRLWERSLDADFMIHRNTMIATPEVLYLGDQTSCKMFDAATGELKSEITVPAGLTDGPVWKWMALEGGTLYALVGEEEPPGDKLEGKGFRGAGWPWWTIDDYRWGFGRTILAIDPATKKVLWHHREEEPLDTRAMCMKAGRIFFHSQGKFLGCLDAESGQMLWRSDDRKVLDAIADRRPAQRAVWGFATSSYAKCTDQAVYFAGPQQTKLVAVSATDGKLLWKYAEEGNFQLVLRDDGLYAMGSNHASRKFDPLTGQMLLKLPNRAACTRATGSVDRVFVRGRGTKSWNVATNQWTHLSPMRPACHDGVVVAGGHLYWGPWMCGCNLSLIGVVSLGPAGDFDFSQKAIEAERLQTAVDDPTDVAPLPTAADDWPTYRKDNARSTRSQRTVAATVHLKWEYRPDAPTTPSAPVTAGNLVFIGNSDGVVKALDAADGRERWTAHTGGALRLPPSIADGRALVGSADGWIYAYEAATGRLLWRFRAAPVERKIPVYGSLQSTWPVGAGVLVHDGVAYAAAGIANYDGTHVYALDAATGRIRWQNNTSGKTSGMQGTGPSGQGTGASVQGDLLLSGDKLYMAGGNVVALASYDLADGKFAPARAAKSQFDRKGPRGKDLFLRRDGLVGIGGRFPMYTRPEDTHYIDYAELDCPPGTVVVIANALGLVVSGESEEGKPKPIWGTKPFQENVAVAITPNALIVAGTNRQTAESGETLAEDYGLTALDLTTGKPLWTHPLPAASVGWGLAVDRQGRILVTLRDGRVQCFEPAG